MFFFSFFKKGKVYAPSFSVFYFSYNACNIKALIKVHKCKEYLHRITSYIIGTERHKLPMILVSTRV